MQADKASGQMNFFGAGGFGQDEQNKDEQSLPDVPPWGEQQMLLYEKEVLGFYVTSNPLSKHADMISVYSTVNTSQLTHKSEGREVVIGGMVAKIRHIVTKNGRNAGAKMIHAAPHTSSRITSKSISKAGGRASYRGMVKVYPKAAGCKVSVECDALLIDEDSRSDTYPTMEIAEDQVQVEHEARVSKVSEEQLFYLQSRGLSEDEARLLIVNGFIEPFTKELPMEYAVELNRLIELEMEGSVG